MASSTTSASISTSATSARASSADGVFGELRCDLDVCDLGQGLLGDGLGSASSAAVSMSATSSIAPAIDGLPDDLGLGSILLGDLLADLREGGREGVVDTALRLLDGLGAVVSRTLRTRRPPLARRTGRRFLRLLEAEPEAVALGVERDQS